MYSLNREISISGLRSISSFVLIPSLLTTDFLRMRTDNVSYNVYMRKFFEVVITALLSSWITIGILYSINPNVLDTILNNQENEVLVIDNTNSDILSAQEKAFKTLENEFIKLEDELESTREDLSLLKEVIKNQNDGQSTVVQGPKGDPGEVPQEYLSKVDQIESKLLEQSLCVESIYEFFINRNNWYTSAVVKVDNNGRDVVSVRYVFFEDKFNC